jgi:pimeloyl-ACP methyl ester carboxylesterase
MEKRKARRKRIIFYLIALPLIHLGFCFALAQSYVSPSRLISDEMPDSVVELVIDHTPHNLVAWSTPGLAEGAPQHDTVVILAHGYGGNRDYFNDLIQKLQGTVEILVPAMHGQDASHADKVGFGVGEAAEISTAIKWVHDQYEEAPRVVLFGTSLGGSACWLAAAEHPSLVDAVITEGAFATLEEANDEFLRRLFGGVTPVMRPVIWFAYKMGKVDPAAFRPIDAASSWTGHSLVIHGDDDKMFDRDHGQRLADATGTELWIAEGMGHAHLAGDAPTMLAERIIEITPIDSE